MRPFFMSLQRSSACLYTAAYTRRFNEKKTAASDSSYSGLFAETGSVPCFFFIAGSSCPAFCFVFLHGDPDPENDWVKLSRLIS